MSTTPAASSRFRVLAIGLQYVETKIITAANDVYGAWHEGEQAEQGRFGW